MSDSVATSAGTINKQLFATTIISLERAVLMFVPLCEEKLEKSSCQEVANLLVLINKQNSITRQ